MVIDFKKLYLHFTLFFASQINNQTDPNLSWKPDPRAITINAFSMKCNTEFYYIIAPFSLIRKVAAKIVRDFNRVYHNHTQMVNLMLAPKLKEEGKKYPNHTITFESHSTTRTRQAAFIPPNTTYTSTADMLTTKKY